MPRVTRSQSALSAEPPLQNVELPKEKLTRSRTALSNVTNKASTVAATSKPREGLLIKAAAPVAAVQRSTRRSKPAGRADASIIAAAPAVTDAAVQMIKEQEAAPTKVAALAEVASRDKPDGACSKTVEATEAAALASLDAETAALHSAVNTSETGPCLQSSDDERCDNLPRGIHDMVAECLPLETNARLFCNACMGSDGSKCKAVINKGESFYSCSACDFDICHVCVEKRVAEKANAKAAPSSCHSIVVRDDAKRPRRLGARTQAAAASYPMVVHGEASGMQPKVRLGQRAAAKMSALSANPLFAGAGVDVCDLEAAAAKAPMMLAAPKRAFLGDRAAAKESAEMLLVPARKMSKHAGKAALTIRGEAPAGSSRPLLLGPSSSVQAGSMTIALAATGPAATAVQCHASLPDLCALVACSKLPMGGGSPLRDDEEECTGGGGLEAHASLLSLGSAPPAWSDLPLPRGAQHKEEANKLQLRRLRRYLVSLGASADVLTGWRTETKWSRSVGTYGKHATWYITPSGRKLSSEAEVARFFGLLNAGGGAAAGGGVSGGGGGGNGAAGGGGAPSSALVTAIGRRPACSISAANAISNATALALTDTSTKAGTDAATTSTAAQPLITWAPSDVLLLQAPATLKAAVGAPGAAALEEVIIKPVARPHPSGKPPAKTLAERRGGRALLAADSASRMLSDGPAVLETVRMPSIPNLDSMLSRKPDGGRATQNQLQAEPAPPAAPPPGNSCKQQPVQAAKLSSASGAAKKRARPVADANEDEGETAPPRNASAARGGGLGGGDFGFRGRFGGGGSTAPLIMMLPDQGAIKFASPGRLEEYSEDEEEEEVSVLRPIGAADRQALGQYVHACKARCISGAAAQRRDPRRPMMQREPWRPLPAATPSGLQAREEQQELLGLFADARHAVQQAKDDEDGSDDELLDIDEDADDVYFDEW